VPDEEIIELVDVRFEVIEIETPVPGPPGPGATPEAIADAVEDYLTEHPSAPVVHTHTIADVDGLQGELDEKAPLASPAFTGTPTGITKAHVGLGNVDNTADEDKPLSNAATSALAGKSDTGHTHTSAAITDFGEAVQDAVAAMLAEGANISLVYDDDGNTLTVSATGGGGGDAEMIRDTIGAAIQGLGNISVLIDDAADTITVVTTATVNSTDAELRDRETHTGTQSASTISDFDTAADARVAAGITGKLDTSAAPELIRDTMGTALVAGAGVTVTPNDGAETITVASDGNAAVNTVAATGSTETLSAAFELHKVTMDQNCTFTFTSPSAGAVFAVLLSGAFTPTWPATVDWPDGTTPTHSTPALYVFATFDAGTSWQGVQSGKAFS